MDLLMTDVMQKNRIGVLPSFGFWNQMMIGDTYPT
jgi:hypothetical protein